MLYIQLFIFIIDICHQILDLYTSSTEKNSTPIILPQKALIKELASYNCEFSIYIELITKKILRLNFLIF